VAGVGSFEKARTITNWLIETVFKIHEMEKCFGKDFWILQDPVFTIFLF